MEDYRALRAEEIDRLNHNHCFCDCWENILVKEGFDARYVRNTLFSGQVRLGVFDQWFDLEGGLKKHAGIYKAIIHNCTIGDNVLIENIHDYIANYTIGEASSITNVNKLVVDEAGSCFGNGTRVAVLDETGGRDVVIFDRMSSHFAYAYTLYRYRPTLIKALENIVLKYTQSVHSVGGFIGKGVVIRNADYIKNVRMGDYTHIEGAARLINGSINSNAIAPVHIGCMVVASDFIISSGSSLDEGAIISRCFIGQACHLRHSYTASDSLFFSNCQGENGEACAIFAGPYTVTHHKSTLLIAGVFSFMNAGSGSNQSNHLYKLGPIHQGIVERGSKTTSNSYVLWPAYIGTFSLIMGRHYRHINTSLMPFSYVIEHNDESYLAPAVNLQTVGTIRDFLKWPKRDGRKDPQVLDYINFSLFNPFTMGKILAGIQGLEQLQEQQGLDTHLYNYQGCVITLEALKRGIKLYQLAVDKYFGDCLIRRIKKALPFQEDSIKGLGDWVDISGLIVPRLELELLFVAIEEGNMNEIEEINHSFKKLHDGFSEYEWNWVFDKMQDYYSLSGMQAKDCIHLILKHWLDASIALDLLICNDAKKEFSRLSTVGFGMDGSINDANSDLNEVRGSYDDNTFVLNIKKQIEDYRQTYHELLTQK